MLSPLCLYVGFFERLSLVSLTSPVISLNSSNVPVQPCVKPSQLVSGGSILDGIATRCNLPAPRTSITDDGLTRYGLLQWSASTMIMKPPTSIPKTCQAWKSVSFDDFWLAVYSSQRLLKNEIRLSMDTAAKILDVEMNFIADQLAPHVLLLQPIMTV
jgi:hypothetical protein